jgi:leucyl aminopeptidase
MPQTLPLIDTAERPIPVHVIRPEAWADVSAELTASQRAFATALDFKGQSGRFFLAPAADGTVERIVFALASSVTPMAIAGFASQLQSGTYAFAALPDDISPTLATTAWALGTYRFTPYKQRKSAPAHLVMPEGVDAAEARAIASAVYLVRDLVNTPAGDMGPDALQRAAEEVAGRFGATCEAIVGDALLSQNYPLIHAVGRAAGEAPRLLHLAWGAEDAPKIALVGKGVTFDSGGLDIKPSAGMRIMKKDMGGAAHALALAQLIMELNLNVRLDVWLPVVENAIAGNAFRPGDIFKSRKGLTVEIDNTDAEGRLILADALARASEETPELILDFATLTGAARTALGPDLPPLFTDDETLAADLAAAAQREHDPLWRLPLWAAYEADMDSPIADLKNTGDGAFAGAIYGGLFLKRFVNTQHWAHFDVFAWSPRERGGRPSGGEAHALRAVWSVLKARYPHR